MGAAFGGEALVDAVDVFVEERLVAPGPRLDHAVFAQFGDERGGVGVFEFPERPAEQVDVGVNDTGRGGTSGGGDSRW